jgi:hypothetical protein
MEDRFFSSIHTDDSKFLFTGMTSSVDGFNQWALVVKTDELLNIEWTKVYGDNGNASFTNIILTDDGFMCVGFNLTSSNSYDGVVINFSADGDVIWEKTFGGADWDFFHDCHLASDGYIICGETYNETFGGTDGWLLKLDFDGNLLWEKRLGSENDETFNSIDEFVNGDLVLGGDMENDDIQQMWIVKTNSSGDLIHENFFGNIDNQKNSVTAVLTDFINENYYYAGYLYNPENDSQDAVSGGLDISGNVIWVDTVSTSGTQSWNSLEYGNVNELVVSGVSEGAGFGLEQNDFFVRRLTRESGIFVSQTVEGTGGNDICNSGIVDGNGFIYSGITDGQGNGQDDGFIIKTGSSGSSENSGLSESEFENIQELVHVDEIETISFQIINHHLVLETPEKVGIYDYSGRLIQQYENVTKVDLQSFDHIIVLKIGDYKGFILKPS